VISGVDLVQAQFAVAGGLDLADIGLASQNVHSTTHHPSASIYIHQVNKPTTTEQDVQIRGYAIQCRVTTEDPERGFAPDTGRIIAYREPQGLGIRLDGANGYPGAEISVILCVDVCCYDYNCCFLIVCSHISIRCW
jgi:pyruvate carboxylase